MTPPGLAGARRALGPPVAPGRRLAAGLLAAVLGLLAAAPGPAGATSAVFDGDPVDPASGVPYEILPGQPLVRPGADGRPGTFDDVIDRTLLGDIDLVVRLGEVAETGEIPPPAVRRGAIAAAVAGSRGAGAALPFTVYLSDGAVAPGRPYGGLLAAPDMDGLPVVVLVFADRDADGVIGPSGAGGGRPGRQVRALAEIEPVGREVALFSGGIASGTVAVTAGGPAAAGGVALVATALAFTGPYDAGFLGGLVPSGPGVSTAQPFLPERDPGRLFTSDLGPLEAGGTLNPEPRAAALPGPWTGLDLALPADGSSPTVDTARGLAGPPVCARLVERARGKRGVPPEPAGLVLGTAGGAAKARLRLVAVDRFGNPTDPGAASSARIVADGPLAIAPDRDGAPGAETLRVARAAGRSVTVRATGAGRGSLRVFAGGALCQRLAYESRAARNRRGADAVVAAAGRADYRSIGAAVGAAVDRDGDGRITIEVGEGVFPETVRLARAVELRGAGAGRTVIDARGLGPALTLADAGALASGVTAGGGTLGIALEAPVTASGLEARGNAGAGFALRDPAAVVAACVARENGGDGIALEAGGAVTASLSLGNTAAGVAVTAGAGARVTESRMVANGRAGIALTAAAAPTIAGNASAGNLDGGLAAEDLAGGEITANRLAANDGDGLRLDRVQDTLVDGNDLTANGGYGMRLRDASADFDALPGPQPPPGSNDVSDNRKGPLRLD